MRISYSSLWLYILIKKELSGPKSGLLFALDLSERCGCSEAVQGEAGGCSVRLGVRELRLGEPSGTPGEPGSVNPPRLRNLEQVNSPTVGILCASGYASAQVFYWIGALVSV